MVATSSLSSYGGITLIINDKIPIDGGSDLCKRYGPNAYKEMNSLPGLLQAAHKSFSYHLPLVLKADYLLITVIQALGIAVERDTAVKETIAGVFGKLNKNKVRVFGNDEDPCLVFEKFRIAIGKSFGKSGKLITEITNCDFSTSCRATKSVANIAIMKIYANYAEYTHETACGIPAIHLMGDMGDWKKLAEKINKLSILFPSLSWWFDPLKPVIGKFVELWDNKIDKEFWANFYNMYSASGHSDVTGEINAFYPYVWRARDEQWEAYNFRGFKRNQWFTKKNGEDFKGPDISLFYKVLDTKVEYEKMPGKIKNIAIGELSIQWIRQIKIGDITTDAVAPLAKWEIRQLEGSGLNVVASGMDTIEKTRNSLGKNVRQIQSSPAAAAAAADDEKPEAIQDDGSREDNPSILEGKKSKTLSTDKKVSMIVHPCWHVVHLEPSDSGKYPVPDKCPHDGCEKKPKKLYKPFS